MNIADQFNTSIGDRVAKLRGPVPVKECLKVALHYEAEFIFYCEHGQPWVELQFSDGSNVVLGLDEGEANEPPVCRAHACGAEVETEGDLCPECATEAAGCEKYHWNRED